MKAIKIVMLFALLLCNILWGSFKIQKYVEQYVVPMNNSHHVYTSKTGREVSNCYRSNTQKLELYLWHFSLSTCSTAEFWKAKFYSSFLFIKIWLIMPK